MSELDDHEAVEERLFALIAGLYPKSEDRGAYETDMAILVLTEGIVAGAEGAGLVIHPNRGLCGWLPPESVAMHPDGYPVEEMGT